MSEPYVTESLEESLDPAGPTEWSKFRALAHRMVDDMLDHLSTIRDQAVWRSPPPEVRSALSSSLPLEGQGEEAASGLLRLVIPIPTATCIRASGAGSRGTARPWNDGRHAGCRIESAPGGLRPGADMLNIRWYDGSRSSWGSPLRRVGSR